ncbi:CAAX prenyl protease-related protein [Novosphingobium sp.]|uniref:CAAX prenyl protease-related protein n=1 Tax=Novosphingobium sp. TaxID=1874826 RepID=UPI002629D79E|nr:CAAX prenyl protease-related protein [Novosphingobium sp.]
MLVASRKQARSDGAEAGDLAVTVRRKKPGGASAAFIHPDAVAMPRKKPASRKAAEKADDSPHDVVDVRLRRTIVSNRILTTLLQLLILGLTGFVAAQQFQGADQSDRPLVAVLAWLPAIVRGVLLASVAVLAHCVALYRQDLYEAWERAPSVRIFVAHFALAITNFIAVAAAPPLVVALKSGGSAWLAYYAVAPVLWASYLATGFALLVPGWEAFARTIRLRAGALGALVLVCYVGWRLFEQSGYPSSRPFIQATMAVVTWISDGVGHPLWFVKIADNGIPVYRAGTFTAFILPGCSGLEGMMLTAGMLLAAVAMEHRRLRIWFALVLVTLAVCGAFLVNVVRLVLLFYIGDKWSAEVAVTGFHANFGVFSFVCISILFFLAIRRYADKARSGPIDLVPPRIGLMPVPPTRVAYPLMASIAATLLVGLFSGTFNWFYPVPTLSAAFLLVRLKLPAQEPDWSITAIPVGAGALVFWLWIMLVPADADASAKFAETLFGASPLLATPWLIVRFAGSILVVPIAEELTFRALLLPWAMRALDRHVARSLLAPLALVLNAAAFGAMHSGVAAGMVAGLIFGLVFWRRRSCRDAILAHACSNLLLCLYVLGSGDWSYL